MSQQNAAASLGVRSYINIKKRPLNLGLLLYSVHFLTPVKIQKFVFILIQFY